MNPATTEPVRHITHPPCSFPPHPHRQRVAGPLQAPGVLTTLLLGLLALVPPLEAQDPGQDGGSRGLTLSLEEAVARAQAGNPSLRVARNEEAPAEWELRAARGNLLPSLSTGFGVAWEGSGQQRIGGLTSDDLGIETPSYYFSSYTLGFNLGISGNTLLAPRRAAANLEATRARIGSAEAGLVLDVTRTYLDVLRADEGVRLAQRELARAEANLALAQAQVAVGAATSLEARQAEVAVGRARVSLVREEGAARNARISLFQLMGEDVDGRDLRLTSTFDLTPVTEDEEELYRISLERNPDLAALMAQEEASIQGLRVARSTYFPSLSLQGGWSGFTRQASSDRFLLDQAQAQAQNQVLQCRLTNEIFSRLADPLPTLDCGQYEWSSEDREAVLAGNRAFPFDFTRQPPSVSLSISFPLFQGFQRQQQVETARAGRNNARLQVREQRIALRSEIARSLVTARTAYEAARLEEANLEVADSQLELAREQFQAGLVDFLQLADAEAVRARADREYLAAVYAYHEARAVLEAVVGAPLTQP